MTKATSVLGIKLEEACSYLDKVTESTPTTLMINLVNAIADYLEQQVSFSGNFTGNLIATPFSPITSPVANGKLLATGLRSVTTICSDPKGGDGNMEWIAWMNSIYTGIKTTTIINTSVTVPIAPTVVFPSLTLTWGREVLLNAYNSNSSIFDAMANSILSDLKMSYIPSYPSTITGTAIGTDIIAGFVFS